jgi:hypothetical protein
MRYISDDSEDVRGVNDLLSDGLSVLSNHSCDNCVEHEIAVAHQLDTGESSDAANKQLSCTVEVADKHAIDALEDLEFVLLVPVGSLLDQYFTLIDVLLDGINVELLDVHEQNLKKDLHLL